MAVKLSWSPEALEDIEAIASYIERDSPWYAETVVSKIITVAESIPEFPEIGRIVPELGTSEIRERFVYSYRLIYRLEPTRIVITAVIHGSRLLDSFVNRVEDSEVQP
jgi:toxin ParE1/3/4